MTCFIALSSRPAGPRAAGPLATLLALADLRRSRRSLAKLDPERLRDLGLSHEQALREAHRPVWDAPEHWLR